PGSAYILVRITAYSFPAPRLEYDFPRLWRRQWSTDTQRERPVRERRIVHEPRRMTHVDPEHLHVLLTAVQRDLTAHSRPAAELRRKHHGCLSRIVRDLRIGHHADLWSVYAPRRAANQPLTK